MSADMLAAFDEWFAEHGAALAIPMTVVSCPADSIRLMFSGLTDAIEVIVQRHDITVSVTNEGKWQNLSVVLECGPEPVANGIVCGLCNPVDRVICPQCLGIYRAKPSKPHK